MSGTLLGEYYFHSQAKDAKYGEIMKAIYEIITYIGEDWHGQFEIELGGNLVLLDCALGYDLPKKYRMKIWKLGFDFITLKIAKHWDTVSYSQYDDLRKKDKK